MAYDSKGTLNKVMLIGRLGQDPELKYTPSGSAVCTISMATNTSYKAQDGNMVENTEWHRVVFWRKAAESVAQYLKKGSRIYVEGKLATRSWDDQNGVKRYTTEITADQFSFLDSPRDSGGPSSAPQMPDDAHMAEPTPEEGDDLPF
ncbi:single-stranded DNA-binding protein [candidate division KSB1 bacterium]|nr:single-stranded DNA-binding protein [candidate division KSB1 bacterium]RQW00199.1 MAG: single-stranded DNA-binding protein [candidate division KSB1 bacterium]